VSGTARILRVPRPSRVTATFASRVGAPVIDTAAVADVLERYGISYDGALRNLRLARRSLNVVVATPSGRRVLKCYRPRWPAATVRYGHSILEHLEARAVPRSAGASVGCDVRLRLTAFAFRVRRRRELFVELPVAATGCA
jgi:hypothetical protein